MRIPCGNGSLSRLYHRWIPSPLAYIDCFNTVIERHHPSWELQGDIPVFAKLLGVGFYIGTRTVHFRNLVVCQNQFIRQARLGEIDFSALSNKRNLEIPNNRNYIYLYAANTIRVLWRESYSPKKGDVILLEDITSGAPVWLYKKQEQYGAKFN